MKKELLTKLNYKESKHKLGLFYKNILEGVHNHIFFIDTRSTTQDGNIGFWMKNYNRKLFEEELNKFKQIEKYPVRQGMTFYYLYPIYHQILDTMETQKPVREKLLEYSEDSKYSDNNIARECAICGKRYSPFSSSIVKHHLLYPDQNWKGLEVTVTVCRSCHGKIHMTDEYPRLKPSYWRKKEREEECKYLFSKLNIKLKEKIRDTSNLMKISISKFIKYSLVQVINDMIKIDKKIIKRRKEREERFKEWEEKRKERKERKKKRRKWEEWKKEREERKKGKKEKRKEKRKKYLTGKQEKIHRKSKYRWNLT